MTPWPVKAAAYTVTVAVLPVFAAYRAGQWAADRLCPHNRRRT